MKKKDVKISHKYHNPMFKGYYKLTYTLNREPKELVVEVELKQVQGPLAARQNVYYGEAKVNDKPYNEKDLSHCVNAQFAAEEIGEELKEKLKNEAKSEGKSFRINKNDLK